MTTILLLTILAFQPAVQDDGHLYKITLLRAAPGHLLDVIDAYRARIPVYDAAGDPRPMMVRHSQGDHWDLMVIEPVESLQSGMTPHQFAGELQRIVAWKEDLW